MSIAAELGSRVRRDVIGVVGGTGLIGSALIHHFRKVGLGPLRLFLRHSSPEHPDVIANAEICRGDLSSSDDCQRFVDGLSTIYYLAHRNTPVVSDLDLPGDFVLNSVPLLNLIQSVRRGSKKTHLIYFSSGGAIYGSGEEKRRPFVESDPPRPTSSYGIQKLMAEQYLRLAAERGALSATVLRIGNAYGSLIASDRLQGLIGTAVNSTLHGRPVRLFGNNANIRDYIHLDDICRIAERVVDPVAAFSIFNVGSQEGHSVDDVLALIERHGRRPVVRQVVADPNLGAWMPSWCVLDVDRAKSVLNWTPRVALSDGIARMFTEAEV